jgi:hypothetical protein
MSEAIDRGCRLTSKEQAMASAVQFECATDESESRRGAQVRSSCPPLPPLHKKGNGKEICWQESGWRYCRPLGPRLATVRKHWLVADNGLVKKLQ